MAAVEDDTVDAVALAADGKPAGYGWREGRPVALASCGPSATATAFAGSSGRVTVSIRGLPDMIGAGSQSRLALSRVSALSCDASARRFWIAGEQDGRTVVIAVERRRSSQRLHSAPAGAAVSFSGGRAYVASAGRVDVVTLSSGKVRSVRHGGAFRQLSVASGRIAGPAGCAAGGPRSSTSPRGGCGPVGASTGSSGSRVARCWTPATAPCSIPGSRSCGG